ncbi:hypothetical protein ABIC09_001582 [Bradyrhizobium sp. S3.12.5]|uniref:hypothetical protein n=1 Tax=Bradyrhizobium sp. S3.12.5 TaxID=3156386 RepID=UPI003399106D
MLGRWIAAAVVSLVLMMQSALAQSLRVDPETIVPLPPGFDMEPPASDVPPEIARFQRDLERRQAHPRGRARQG